MVMSIDFDILKLFRIKIFLTFLILFWTLRMIKSSDVDILNNILDALLRVGKGRKRYSPSNSPEKERRAT